ncbi:MAG: glycosyltransferase [Myxococcales bacterium]|nr:glycosyltransferase [Myxococcales bacterium]
MTPTPLLFFAPLPWDAAARQRPHHLARLLARRGFAVFYVEPASDAEGYSPEPGLIVVGDGTALHRRRLARWLASVPLGDVMRRAFGAVSGDDPLNLSRDSAVVQAVDHRLGLTPPGIVLIELPHHAPMALRLQRQGWTLVYDRLDPSSASADIGPFSARYDEQLYARAEIVTVTTESLNRGRHGLKRPATVIPNGVDLARFQRRKQLAVIPRSLPAGRPIAGYVGTLGPWFDWERVIGLARSNPAWNIVLVGPGRIPKEVVAVQNLHLLGPRSYEALPEFVQHFRVGLIPFKGRDITGVDPVKAYEYLACGVPVLSVPFPALEGVPGVTLTAASWNGWLDELGHRRFPDDAVQTYLKQRDWGVLSDRLAAALAHPEPQPPLSVVIPTYNGRAHLERCLWSMARQTLKELEVIVVDDRSSDDTVSFCAQCYPQFRLLRSAENVGFARAANAGIRAARSPFIALLNNDTEMAPDWAENVLVPFQDPRIGSVASFLCQMQRPSRVDRAGDGYSAVGGAFNRLHNQVDPTDPPRFEEVFGASAAAAVYRRAALVEVGLLDESFEAYYEDVDLAWRLQLAGWPCVLHHGARGLHLGSASYQKGGERFVRFSARNAETVYWSALPPALLAKHLPGHVAFLVLQSVHRLVSGELGPYLRGKLEVLRSIPSLLQHRQERQALRTIPASEIERLIEKRWFRQLVRQLIDRHS